MQVGHEQVKSMLGEFSLRDIFVAFVSKMDNIEQMNEREKKEICKVYISFVDVYKFQLLEDHYYEKFLESASKKTLGVSELVAHLCKVTSLPFRTSSAESKTKSSCFPLSPSSSTSSTAMAKWPRY